MQKRVTLIQKTDDFDGSLDAETVPFAFDGVRYEIELSEANQKEMRELLAPYIERARVVGTKARAKAKPRRGQPKPAVVRAWAAENGIEVPATGRISKDVMEQYKAAQK